MQEKKRYCIFSAQYLPHMGGVERYTYNLAKKLIEKGNGVTIVTSNTMNLSEYEEIDGIEIYRIPCVNLLEGRYPVLKMNKKFVRIDKILKDKQFDMVIVNTRFYLHSLYGMIYAYRKKIFCITIEHGTSHLSVHNKFFDFIGGIFEHFLTKIGFGFCKNYYGVSEACNEWLKHFHIQAKGVLYNSINVDEVEQIKDEIHPIYREKYKIPETAIVVTFTGRLLPEKGLPSLLNVMEKLCDERQDLYLMIAGDGDMYDEIDARKTTHIIPLGRLDFRHIVTLLEESNIFCLPSFSEGFSTSILEAATCRCYILTTARGGAKELLVSDEYGSIIPNNDEEVLYLALKEILNNHEKIEKATELTYQRVKNHFTWENVAKSVEKICERMEP